MGGGTPGGLGQRLTARLGVVALVAAGLFVGTTGIHQPKAHADAVPQDGYSLSLVADQLRQPIDLRQAPDGRLFLLQQIGLVRIVKNGRLLHKPALKMSGKDLVALNNSAGLISIAFPPNFDTAPRQHVYLLYTHVATAKIPYRHNVVSRWRINGNVIDPNSQKILVDLDPLVSDTGGFATSHYGGDMVFGPDGKLYVTTGDLYNAVNGQDLTNRNGKILRYNPDGSIPHDNAFFHTLTGPNRAIWDYGFRNPFHITEDPQSGVMVVGDVGSWKFEEVDVLAPGTGGQNYGWATAEGYTTDPAFVSPILAYPHTSTTSSLYGCAVTGGDMYRPDTPTMPKMQGRFLFADLCQGWLRSINPRTGKVSQPLVTGLNMPVDVSVDPKGDAWILQRSMPGEARGGLLRLDYVGFPTAPSITTQPADHTSPTHGSATFTVYASGSQPLKYHWYRDDVKIPGATSSSYTVSDTTSTDDGATFKVRVANSIGTVDSREAVLTVSANQAPVPVITAPVNGDPFDAGESLHIEGTATDPEDGDLPASAFTWVVVLHHNTHTHDIMEPVKGVKSFDFTLPRDVEVDTNIWYRVHLTVADSDGATTEVTSDVLPNLTSFTADTDPSGLGLLLDGVPTTTPLSTPSVVGTTRTLEAAPSVVDADGQEWDFTGWSDGDLSPRKVFNADATPQTYTALYTAAAAAPQPQISKNDALLRPGATNSALMLWITQHSTR